MTTQKYTQIVEYLKSIIANTIWENHVFTVGGCVRDQVMNREIKDIDLVVDLFSGGIRFANWLNNNGYCYGPVVTYENFGTAMFHLKEFPDIELEVVQTRSECYHDAKSRNPETSFGTIKQDWERRDFTINAMYYDISNDKLIDFENRGVNDVKNGVIRTCGEPDIIFVQDPLRQLRMCRFSSRLGFKISQETFDSAKRNIDRLEIISKERINDEFTKMITYSNESIINSLCLLWDLGAFKYIIPDLNNISVKNMFTILTSIKKMLAQPIDYFKFLDNLKIPREIPVLTKLLYFAGIISNNDDEQYYRNILKELKYSNEISDYVCFLLKENKKIEEFSYNNPFNDSNLHIIRKIMNECGCYEKFYLSTIIGDDNISNEFHSFVTAPMSFFMEIIKEDSWAFDYKLPVDGNYIMEYFNIPPSKQVKEILRKTLNFVFINPDQRDKDNVLNFLKYLKKTDYA